eukprot:2147308-Rhodomonas_salina.2
MERILKSPRRPRVIATVDERMTPPVLSSSVDLSRARVSGLGKALAPEKIRKILVVSSVIGTMCSLFVMSACCNFFASELRSVSHICVPEVAVPVKLNLDTRSSCHATSRPHPLASPKRTTTLLSTGIHPNRSVRSK